MPQYGGDPHSNLAPAVGDLTWHRIIVQDKSQQPVPPISRRYYLVIPKQVASHISHRINMPLSEPKEC